MYQSCFYDSGTLSVPLPEIDMLHLKMDVWNTSFLVELLIFRGYVSFREGTYYMSVYWIFAEMQACAKISLNIYV